MIKTAVYEKKKGTIVIFSSVEMKDIPDIEKKYLIKKLHNDTVICRSSRGIFDEIYNIPGCVIVADTCWTICNASAKACIVDMHYDHGAFTVTFDNVKVQNIPLTHTVTRVELLSEGSVYTVDATVMFISESGKYTDILPEVKNYLDVLNKSNTPIIDNLDINGINSETVYTNIK